MPVRDLLSAASGTGGAVDPYFYDVSLLLNGDGTNGAQNNTFLDSSTNNFTITRNGNTTQGSFSPYGNLWSNYTDFSSCLSVAYNSALNIGSNDFTIEGWWCASSQTSNEALWAQKAGSQYFILQPSISGNNLLALYIDPLGAAPAIQGSTALKVGVWYHIALVRQSGVFKLYLNGVQEGGTYTNSGNPTPSGATTYINGQNYPVAAGFNGYVSNFRIVNGTAVYTTTFTPPTTPLTAITNTVLLTCQSNRFIDNSTNNFTITANGTPQVQRFSPFNPTAPYSTSVIGGSGYFDGSSYLTVANNAAFQFGSSNWTVQVWIYFTNAGGIQVITNFGYGAPNTNRSWLIYINSGDFRIAQSPDGSTNYDTSLGLSTPVANTWYQLTVSRSGSTVQGFLNGVAGTALTAYNLYACTGSLYISTQDGTNYPIIGYMSDYRILKGTGYTSVTVPTAPLTAITNTSLLLNYTNAGIPDLAMQNNLQTVGSAQVSTSVKKYGTGSISFASGANYLSIPAIQSQNLTGQFTIEHWIYFNSTPGTTVIWGNMATSTSGGWQLITSGGTSLIFQQSGTSTNQTTASFTPSTGTWYHLAVTWDGTTLRIFVNGTLAGSNTALPPNTFQGWDIGGRSDGYGIDGYIDDFRITNGLARYTANFTPPTSALPTY